MVYQPYLAYLKPWNLQAVLETSQLISSMTGFPAHLGANNRGQDGENSVN